jgi:hypothetical protein
LKSEDGGKEICKPMDYYSVARSLPSRIYKAQGSAESSRQRFWIGKLLLMRTSLIIILTLGIFSCKSKSNNNSGPKPISVNVPTVREDSLDLNASEFITTNFPTAVKTTLYHSDDSLWKVISSFYVSGKFKELAKDSFLQSMSIYFSIDTLPDKILLWRRQFNKRTAIELRDHPVDSITVSNQLWYLGRKYILISEKWN